MKKKRSDVLKILANKLGKALVKWSNVKEDGSYVEVDASFGHYIHESVNDYNKQYEEAVSYILKTARKYIGVEVRYEDDDQKIVRMYLRVNPPKTLGEFSDHLDK